MNKQLLKNTVVLITSNILVRILGLIYKIWLAQAVTPEALGYYQLSLSVYMFFISLPCSGLPNSISRHYAESYNEKTQGQVIYEGFRLGVMLSIAGGTLLALFAPMFSWLLLKDIGRFSVFLALVPSIVFGGAASALYGYLHASSKSSAVAISEFVEQLGKILTVFLLIYLFKTSDDHVQATYMAAGIGVGGIISFGMIFAFIGKIKRDKNTVVRQSLIRSALPLTANRFITSLLGIVTSTLIPIRLVDSGLSTQQAFSIYGVINAMAMPVIMLPSTLTSALCVTLLPRFSAIKAAGNTDVLKARVKKVLLLTGGSCLFFTVILMIFANRIGSILFSNNDAQRYIFLLAPCCLFVGINQLCSTLLTSVGNESAVFKIHITTTLISLASSFLLSGIFGPDGYAISLIIQSASGSIIFLMSLRNHFKKQLSK